MWSICSGIASAAYVAVFPRIPGLWVQLRPCQAHDREPVPELFRDAAPCRSSSTCRATRPTTCSRTAATRTTPPRCSVRGPVATCRTIPCSRHRPLGTKVTQPPCGHCATTSNDGPASSSKSSPQARPRPRRFIGDPGGLARSAGSGSRTRSVSPSSNPTSTSTTNRTDRRSSWSTA